jgi:cobalt-zinc-cadmium efflux system membrane fusion protein
MTPARHRAVFRLAAIAVCALVVLGAIVIASIPRTRAFVFRKTLEAAHGRPSPEGANDEGPFEVRGGCIRVTHTQALAMDLRVSAARPDAGPVTLSITGKTGLDPERVAHVHAQFTGRIAEIGPLLGTRVYGPGDSAGPQTVLCVIESTDLASVKSAWLQARAQADQDADQVRRMEQLTRDQVVSDKALLDAQIALRKSRAALEQARQQLLIFGLRDEDFSAIESQQGRERMVYRVLAPRSGTIIEKNVTRGELADPTQNLFTIADLSSLWVWGDVYERDWDKVRLGQRMEVDVSARAGETRRCAIDWISPVLDTTTRSIKIRGTLDNADGRLLADLFATIRLSVEEGAASVVPASALVSDAHGTHALVRAAQSPDESTYERREVACRGIDAGSVRIVSGVRPGEQVVDRGALALLTQMAQAEREHAASGQ